MEIVAPALDSPPLRRQSPPTVYRGADPGANTNFTQEINDGLWWRLVSIFVRLTPDGNAANRTVTVEYRDGEDAVYARTGAVVTVPASDTTDFFFSAFRDSAIWEVDSTVLQHLDPIILPQGHDFSIIVGSKQAGDTLTRIRYVAEKFYPPSADYYPAFE